MRQLGLIGRSALACLLLLGAGVGATAPASAHPFGPPLEARLAIDGGTVSLSWTGAEDDWVALGERTGAFDEPAAGRTGEELLAGSEPVLDYLAQRISVSHPTGTCEQSRLPVRDLLGEGARFAFACPPGLTRLDVELAVLTDLNEAYRTVLTTPGGQQLLFSVDSPVQEVDLGAATSPSPAGLVPVLGGSLALVAVTVAGVLLAHRRRQVGR